MGGRGTGMGMIQNGTIATALVVGLLIVSLLPTTVLFNFQAIFIFYPWWGIHLKFFFFFLLK